MIEARRDSARPVICAAALMTSVPLMIAFLIFQRGLIPTFLRAGIR